jgi:hypothetical protein
MTDRVGMRSCKGTVMIFLVLLYQMVNVNRQSRKGVYMTVSNETVSVDMLERIIYVDEIALE